jgi:hypothetical protein
MSQYRDNCCKSIFISKINKTFVAYLLSVFAGLSIFCAPCFCSSAQVKQSEYTIADMHPRIYLTEDRLVEIRKRCSDERGAQAKYYAVLKNFADKFTPGKSKPSVSDCIVLSFLNVVGEVPGFEYSQRSINEYGSIGIKLLTQVHPPEDLSYFFKYTPMLIACYDWLFPAMTPEERAIVFKNFTRVADKMQDLLKKPLGRFRGTREMFAYYGVAFYGDGKSIYPNDQKAAANVDIKAKEYADFFVAWHRDQQLQILEATCKGGAYSPGSMYGETFFPDKLWHMDAWITASKDDLYKDNSILTGYPLFWLYQMIPYRTHVRYDCANGRADQPGGIVRFGDYRYIGYAALAKPLNINIAQAQGVAKNNGYFDLAAAFNWMIQYQDDFKIAPFGGPYPIDRWVGARPNLVWDIIFRDGLVEAKSPSQAGLPLAHYFGTVATGPPLKPDFMNGHPEGGGVTVMRSSWEDPNATLLWFKASSYPIVHDHRDQGSFQIYKKGWLAIDSGQYEETAHRGNYNSRTIAHNSLLVYRSGESLNKDNADPIWYGYANDGGQRWVNLPKTVADLSKAEYFIGGIKKFETVPGVYDYAQSDITRAYNSVYVTTEGHEPKVSLVERSIFFLRPDEYIVVFDRVISTKPEYPKRWLLHSVYRPELDGKESFEGLIPYSNKIPGKSNGVRLTGDKHGGISESRDTNMFTVKGWNFGPSDGRLVVRTLLPEKHITRVIGGSDSKGIRKTILVKPYDGDGVITGENIEGFDVGDFVYIGETDKPYSHGTYGKPSWPVDDVYYQGWGKIQSIDTKSKTMTMVPHRYGIPKLQEGTAVLRSDHANANSYEFMDAEYTQWQMHGEAVANAGPFYDQHGSWRIEVEPIERKTEDIFLHVMIPCETATLAASQNTLKENVKVIQRDDRITLEIKGKNRLFSLFLKKDSSDSLIKVTENNKTLLDNDLTSNSIKARTSIPEK